MSKKNKLQLFIIGVLLSLLFSSLMCLAVYVLLCFIFWEILTMNPTSMRIFFVVYSITAIISAISALEEGELEKNSVVKNYFTTAKDGKK